MALPSVFGCVPPALRVGRSKRPHSSPFTSKQVSRPLLLLLCLSASAQNTETPHDTLERAKRLTLSAKTVDQIEPLLEHAVQGFADTNPRSLEYAQALTMLGMVRQFLADLDINSLRDNVEPLYKKARMVYDRSIEPPPQADLALTLELEAQALNLIGEVEEATFLSERAATIRKERVREFQEGAQRFPAAYKPGNGISEPTLVSQTEPTYTNEARFLRVHGSVALRFVVDENGVPQDIVLVRSLGYGLDENAVLAVRTWKFVPGKDETGKPLPTIVNVEVDFKLLPGSHAFNPKLGHPGVSAEPLSY